LIAVENGILGRFQFTFVDYNPGLKWHISTKLLECKISLWN